MRIEIDQSGKIENTNRPTVVGFSNKESGIILITPKDKKAIQKYFRGIGKPKLFIYITFVALVFCLLKNHIKNRDQIIIDREYPGYEKLIAKKFRELVQKKLKTEDFTVTISQIGKKSRAHDLAWKQFHSRSHENVNKVKLELILRIIKTNLKSGSI